MAPGHVSAAQALYKATGPTIESAVENKDPMLVEKVLTSGGETSVKEVEKYFVGIRSKMARKESEAHKAELRALQQQGESRTMFEKQNKRCKGASGSGSE